MGFKGVNIINACFRDEYVKKALVNEQFYTVIVQISGLVVKIKWSDCCSQGQFQG